MRNWFAVNFGNMKKVAKMFERNGFILPSPRCFGRQVKSFDLNLPPKEKTKILQWKMVLNKVASLIL